MYIQLIMYLCLPKSGHYYTWDKAHWNEHGDLQITGRTDDAVRIKGVWLDIPAIESAVVRQIPLLFRRVLDTGVRFFICVTS